MSPTLLTPESCLTLKNSHLNFAKVFWSKSNFAQVSETNVSQMQTPQSTNS